jgi:hypothetical protein
MKLKELNIGDVILAKAINANGKYLPKNYDAVVVEKGRQYVYLEVLGRKIRRKLSGSLPSGIPVESHYSCDYVLFKDEDHFTEYLLAKEARTKLAKFFNYDSGAYKLSDEQVEQISKIIGI